MGKLNKIQYTDFILSFDTLYIENNYLLLQEQTQKKNLFHSYQKE